MQFYAVLLPVATLLATTANAANCYSEGGSYQCLSSTDLWNYREEFCNSDTWRNNAQTLYSGKNGYYGFFIPSNIPNQQACWDSTYDIIDQCLGHKNGGTYSLDGWSMNIDFCS